MNAAIIVAAGRGTRFGGETPKQFLELAGKPVILHTLERFENCAAIHRIVLVLPASEIGNFENLRAKYEFSKLTNVVVGGDSRAASVLNGLNRVDKTTEIVAVHDGARPLVTSEEIERTIAKAKKSGAAILVAPVTDTIKQIDGDKISGTIKRENLRRALTPQCFRFDVLRRAFENPQTASGEFTDESMLVERLGVAISFVEGSARNIKITVPEDLRIAEALIEQFKVQSSKFEVENSDSAF